MTKSFHHYFTDAIQQYIDSARNDFSLRMKLWDKQAFDSEHNEVVGGLLARQLSLSTNIAKSPPIWNMHLLPTLLRCMADVYINFCWITQEPVSRSRQFIEYGLGQEKLAIEKYKESVGEGITDSKIAEFVKQREMLLDMECHRFLIPVNLGSWSEKSIRDMAIEVKEKEFYDLVFTQFSASLHSTWQHIWRLNLTPCRNPLHLDHRVPCDLDLPPDFDLFFNSVKYYCKTLAKFDERYGQEKTKDTAYRSYDLIFDLFSGYSGTETENTVESNS